MAGYLETLVKEGVIPPSGAEGWVRSQVRRSGRPLVAIVKRGLIGA